MRLDHFSHPHHQLFKNRFKNILWIHWTFKHQIKYIPGRISLWFSSRSVFERGRGRPGGREEEEQTQAGWL